MPRFHLLPPKFPPRICRVLSVLVAQSTLPTAQGPGLHPLYFAKIWPEMGTPPPLADAIIVLPLSSPKNSALTASEPGGLVPLFHPGPYPPHLVWVALFQKLRPRRLKLRLCRDKSAEASGRRCIGCQNRHPPPNPPHPKPFFGPLFCLKWAPPLGNRGPQADGSAAAQPEAPAESTLSRKAAAL